MDKATVKQEMLTAYEQSLDKLLADLNDEDDFAVTEQKLLHHLNESGQASAEIVQTHKSFSP